MADRLARLTNLVALLLNAPRPLTLDEVASELEPESGYPAGDEARRQAFERDKRVLREEGIPVEAVFLEGEGGKVGYRIPPDDYYLPDLALTDDERVALHLALAAVPLDSGWGAEARWKLGDVSGADASPLAALPSVEALPLLFEGWRRRAPVEFGYGGSPRLVEPYGLLFREGFWYVVGRDRGRGDLRRFRADRIEGRVTLGEAGSFERPEGFDPAAALASQPFMIGEGSSERVLVLVDAVLADKVEGELGPASVAERRDDGSVVVDVEVTNRVGLRSWVLGMRDHALVLSPPSVRDDVVEWLRAMAGAGAGE
ncbi:MAG: proteasome accessory factor [Acidimicrobiaceae bacterium]|nr:proteasome accessory factor [Acidimicrobiaceae bacterium]